MACVSGRRVLRLMSERSKPGRCWAEAQTRAVTLRLDLRARSRKEALQLGVQRLQPSMVLVQRCRERGRVDGDPRQDELVLVLGVAVEQLQQRTDGARGDRRLVVAGEVGAGHQGCRLEEGGAEGLVDGKEAVGSCHGVFASGSGFSSSE